MKEEEWNFSNTEDDELVILKIPRSEAKILRDMVRRQRAMNWMWKWILTFLLSLIGVLTTMYTFGEKVMKVLSG